MKYLTFEDWKKEYHWDVLTKCRSDCAHCHMSGGPGWMDWDYCEIHDTSLIAHYYRNHGKDLCETCNKFEPKSDSQLFDLYQHYIDTFIKNDPERKYNREKYEFDMYELHKDLGLISGDCVEPVCENFLDGTEE